jgi:hypothetical protein
MKVLPTAPTGECFRYYPSVAQTIAPSTAAVPLACDTMVHDTTSTYGTFDITDHSFTCLIASVWEFHVNFLWDAPPNGAWLTSLFIKNTLPPPDGSRGGEISGTDRTCYQPSFGGPPQLFNQSAENTVQIMLNPGDKIWAVPVIDCGGSLTNAVGGNGNNTCNYFEGKMIG